MRYYLLGLDTARLLDLCRRWRAALRSYETMAQKWPHRWKFARYQMTAALNTACQIAWARDFRARWP